MHKKFQPRALTVVFSKQCSRWWCWLSIREVDLLFSSSVLPWNKHTTWVSPHPLTQEDTGDVGGVLPTAVSVPGSKGSSCTEVAWVGEGDKRRADRWSFTRVQGGEQTAVRGCSHVSHTREIFTILTWRSISANASGAGALISQGRGTSSV